MGKAVVRKCWNSDVGTDGCHEFENSHRRRKRRRSGKRDSGGNGVEDDRARNSNGSSEKQDRPPKYYENGTVCYCDTDLCNEAGGSHLQNAGSAYFTVICVLTLTVLITLSAADDETKIEH